MANALTWSSASSTVGTTTTYTEDFLPNTSAISMNMRLSQVVTRGCFGYYEDPADIVTSVSGGGTDKNRRWTDDDPARATQTPFGATSRRTSLTYNTGTFSFVSATSVLKVRDRRDIMVSSVSGGSSSPPRMLANPSSVLSDWYYPNPTHVVLNTQLMAACTNIATSTDALLNPYPRVIHGTNADATARGFGVDTLRFWGKPVPTSGVLWTRMMAPCKRYVPPNGSLSSNRHTLYGLPDSVYVCYGIVIIAGSDPGSVTGSLTLTQTNALGDVIDVSNVGTIPLSRSSFVSGPDTYYVYLANNSAVGGGSLVSQAHEFSYSFDTDYSGPAIDSSAATIWHKTPCWNDGWAISGDETSADYIPGYVMEVT